MFLPSETARMVLSYMLDTPNLYPKTIDSFLSECPHLAEVVVVAGKELKDVELSPFFKVGWKTLKEVLSEYATIVTKLHYEANKNGMKDSYTEPISKVLDVVMNARHNVHTVPIPLIQMKTADNQTEVYQPPILTTDVEGTQSVLSVRDDRVNQPTVTLRPIFSNRAASKSTMSNPPPSKTLPSTAEMSVSSYTPAMVDASCVKAQSYRRSNSQLSSSAKTL